MEEIDELSKKILSLLLFEEQFSHVYEESGESNRNIVSDVLKTLIIKDLVKVYELREERFIAVNYIEPDHYKGQYFRISAIGMRYL